MVRAFDEEVRGSNLTGSGLRFFIQYFQNGF